MSGDRRGPISALVHHRSELQEYHLLDGGEVVSVLGYDQRGDTVVLLHTATKEHVRGRGYAGALVQEVLADLSARKVHVVVVCPFVRWWQSSRKAKDPSSSDP